MCPACGHRNVRLAQPDQTPPRIQPAFANGPVRSMSPFPWMWVLTGVLACGGGWVLWRQVGTPVGAQTTQASANAADLRQDALLRANAGKPGDPALMQRFAFMNARFFTGALPRVTVRWDAGLADVGPLSGNGVTLHGMFGRVGRDAYILLNPATTKDPRALDRALCHEMVHAYLDSIGDKSASHGEAFQAVLRRLVTQGAFQAIAADPAEKARLRGWLDQESARIDADRHDLESQDAEIKELGLALDRDIAAFNSGQTRLPAEAEVLEARRQAFNQRVIELNERVQRGRDAVAHFNAEVARFNLMMAYPDGLDEASTMAPKSEPQRSAKGG